MPTPIPAQIGQMKQGLDLRPEQIDTNNLLPIFVPSKFFALGNWPGPYARLRNKEIGLTWTVLLPDQAMRYVDFHMQEHWESQKLDWKTLAKSNLADRTKDSMGIRSIRCVNGDISALAFIFEDGLGPSRLLFRGTLSQQFPEGYRVALPEMSCGIAFSANLHGQDMATVQGIIDHCYQKGTRPLAPGSYDPDELLPLDEAA